MTGIYKRERFTSIDYEFLMALDNKQNMTSTLKKLSDDGTSILYISHKLQEIAELCDTATVLRKGKVIGEYDPKTISPKELGEIMVGQPLTTPNRPKKNRKQKETKTVFRKELKLVD